MKFEINYGRDFGGRIGDRWFWRTIDADNEEEATRILFEEHKADYIISVTPIET